MTTYQDEKPISRAQALHRVGKIGDTPMVRVELPTSSGGRHVLLKLEGENPGGSMKDRTARSLVDHVLTASGGNVKRIVESTSGNLGAGLALIARAYSLDFTCIVDPNVTTENLRKVERLGAEVVMVRPDDSTKYLQTRLELARSLHDPDSGIHWTNQYGSPANVRAHQFGTAVEIEADLAGPPDAIFAAVSTCGSLMGLAQHFRSKGASTQVFGVDVYGSVIFGQPATPRLIPGIGASRSSTFLDTSMIAGSVHVSEVDAIAMLHELKADTGLRLGGSSGFVLQAAARYAATVAPEEKIVCLCADGGDNYASTVYNPSWLAAHDLLPPNLRLGQSA